MSKKKILVVDDEKLIVKGIRFSLEQDGMEVDCAYDGEDGLNKIVNGQDSYDLVLLDLIMPRKDGLYVLEELKKKNILKNIIVATSYNEPKVIRKVSEYGVNY